MNKATLFGLLFPIVLSVLWLFIGKAIGKSSTSLLINDPGGSGVTQTVIAAFPGAKVIRAASVQEVAAAFQESGGSSPGQPAVGLAVPAGFDDQLRAGSRPQVQLYFDGKAVSSQTRALVQAAIINSCRALASPEPPVVVNTSVINAAPQQSPLAQVGQIYVPMAMLVSLIVGTTFMPQLLIEEKERKTLRMLMVTPASFEDVLVGKLVVVLVYQFILTVVVLAIQGAFKGQVGLVLLYALLGCLFSVSMGLLLGSLFNTVSAASAVEGPLILIYVVAGIFVGPLGTLVGRGPLILLAKLLPTYYIAEGVFNATQGQGSAAGHLLDIGVILVSTILLLAVSAWALRRQSAVAALI